MERGASKLPTTRNEVKIGYLGDGDNFISDDGFSGGTTAINLHGLLSSL